MALPQNGQGLQRHSATHFYPQTWPGSKSVLVRLSATEVPGRGQEAPVRLSTGRWPRSGGMCGLWTLEKCLIFIVLDLSSINRDYDGTKVTGLLGLLRGNDVKVLSRVHWYPLAMTAATTTTVIGSSHGREWQVLSHWAASARWRPPLEGEDAASSSMPGVPNPEPSSPISPLWLILSSLLVHFSSHGSIVSGFFLFFPGTGPWAGDQPLQAGDQPWVGLSVHFSEKGLWVLSANWFSFLPKFYHSGHHLALQHQTKVLLPLFPRAGLTMCIALALKILMLGPHPRPEKSESLWVGPRHQDF